MKTTKPPAAPAGNPQSCPVHSVGRERFRNKPIFIGNRIEGKECVRCRVTAEILSVQIQKIDLFTGCLGRRVHVRRIFLPDKEPA